ncbi:sugar ABC transporter ATP-binding protein [Micromonospora sp. HK10]|uniref:sugar ABC transporter ATP-binding protein n=1 Tax=Micromonospora sp. HK10 TaxID=1538294 RepID=UPI000628C43F|nr:sugar ABC transporter ATP-binding protein [Micromonospora sp. HK10]KKK06403.1 ABC transporter [Micromonospora sp. HK10]
MLRLRGLSKSFAGLPALRDVSIDCNPGEVLALMGENGAGKSTLLKILAGEHVPDSGTVELDNEPLPLGSPTKARRAGIRIISQEPEIIRDVSVAENIFVGNVSTGGGRRFDRKRLTAAAHEHLRRLGLDGLLQPEARGQDLSPAQRQLVEIARALVDTPKVLALDEPTSSLTDREADALFTLVRQLRDSGVAVIYVSHRMAEIFQLADRIAVLRDGALVGERSTAATAEHEVVRLMVGRDLSGMFVREHAADERVVLTLEDVTTDDVSGISLQVRAGEVVGLAGLVGAGRSELARAVFGDVPLRAGRVLVDGQPIELRSPRDAINAGIGLAPEERKADALLLERSVRDNASLAVLDRLSRFRFVRRGAERELVEGLATRLRVRTPSIEHEVRKLSGGNQQKTVLVRWLARKPKVLILDEPTRGVDVGAKAEIYATIDALAAEGVAVLVVSSELPEVLGLSDRIVVMQNGRITGELTRGEATEERVLALAMADHLTGAS